VTATQSSRSIVNRKTMKDLTNRSGNAALGAHSKSSLSPADQIFKSSCSSSSSASSSSSKGGSGSWCGGRGRKIGSAGRVQYWTPLRHYHIAVKVKRRISEAHAG
jgi:hypothetical protein